jgi:ATP-dependent helicase/nuclease subunit B
LINDPGQKYPWLQDAIAENTEVVTASRRLARELQTVYDDLQLAAGKLSWHTPAIFFWGDWLARLIDSAPDPASLPVRIDSFSASIIWERCLRAHMPDELLGFSGIVRQARQAWRQLNDWAVPVAEIVASARSQDERLFARAANEYQEKLRAGSWVDGAGTAALLAELIEQKSVSVPGKITLAGFDRPVPAVDNVIAGLRKAGCVVDNAPPPDVNASVCIAPFDSQDSQLRAAGAWARSELENSPEAKIAIISPTLESEAGRTGRLILEGLAPGWQTASPGHRQATNVSYGRKLAEIPAIAIALLILKWIRHGLSSREISLILRSKSIGNGEVSGRSRLELVLRKLPDRSWSAASFRRALQERELSEDSNQLLLSIGKIAEFEKDNATLASPADWARQIDQLLEELHWPGDMTLGSDEFQLVNRWRSLLNELAATVVVAPRMRLAEAIQRLSALAAETVYQPQAKSGLVQVLGTLEAAGMQFDAIWISDLDATQWPPVARPSVLLSRKLQKKYGMPDATPTDTLEFSSRVLQRLIGSAGKCVMSWARIKGEAELTVSPLLDDIAAGEYNGPQDPGWYAAKQVGYNTTKMHPVDKAPEVAQDEKIKGGAYTVQRQSIEPFAAFVYGRLGVQQLEAIETGLSASLRGNIIHNALHNLLAERPTQAEIIKWQDEELAQRIGSAADSALAEHIRHADPVVRRILALERRRLRGLLATFVAEECQRTDFSIAEVERAIDYHAHGVHLGLRFDRLDRLPDGSFLIIDYKTGAPKNLLSKDGKPVDLQLVVYADALQQEVGGLALINIDSRSISYKGAGGSVEWGPLDSEAWPQQLDQWRASVHQALQEIAAGDARINLLLSSADGRRLNILSRLEEQKRAD